MTRTLAASLMALALAIGACTSADLGEAADTPTGVEPAATMAPATTVAFAASEEAPAHDGVDPGRLLGTGGIEPVVFQANIGRDIIFTADLTVAVTDVAAAGEAAAREIAALGGFVFGQRTAGGPQPTSVLVFKVQPDDFQEALRRLGDLGELRTQNIASDDVTERIVDLESRINTAEASVERLRQLLAEAGDITTIAQLENQLLERETLLETLRGQLRTLEDQVALATIVLTLTEALSDPGVQVVMSAYAGGGDSGRACPGEHGGLVIDEGTVATVCFEITNVGDTPLADLEFSDRVLDLELDDLTVVTGDIDETLLPGEIVLLAAEVTVERDLRPQPRVTATPLDAEGEPLPGRTVAATDAYFLDAVDPGGVPSFTEGVAASFDFLVKIGLVVVLAAGVALPFLWVPAAAFLVWRYLSRRPRREDAEPQEDEAELLSV